MNDLLVVFADKLKKEGQEHIESCHIVKDNAPKTSDGLYVLGSAMKKIGEILESILEDNSV